MRTANAGNEARSVARHPSRDIHSALVRNLRCRDATDIDGAWCDIGAWCEIRGAVMRLEGAAPLRGLGTIWRVPSGMGAGRVSTFRCRLAFHPVCAVVRRRPAAAPCR